MSDPVTTSTAKAMGGWNEAMGVELVEASPERVVVTFEVDERHLQPFGLVHGGVYCGVIETICSIGAGVAAASRGHTGSVVGLENTTSFIRAQRLGARLTATATPLTRGRTTQVWEGRIENAEGELVATGRVRLLAVGGATGPKA